MPPPHHQHQPSTSHAYHPRHSVLPASSSSTGTGMGMGMGSASAMSNTKARQYANLHAQLDQLNANLHDTENLLRMTAVQAEDMRFLGGYVGALFMGSAKVLGEEGVKGNADRGVGVGVGIWGGGGVRVEMS
ncbi:hypothetical protein BO70DRAFT_352315 [Aspergillus heteromorphus CBS 117.55]|uniref:DASH complex subunit Hsk3 like-domain-containing protein n=1 Tax=Aspergillus heteromorphus CBS 117.55 TaxID=1448321 RepID=A0A317WE22_9EURO|nr:uncharacterized protein BO70DRAFT_352315 [Aspergillus heteromorphus CBS 117.55]PWY83472.1 hypothetical protein BO70DRAFT_352315 [Aspergillus heteromorphus CBS 117.55]